MPYIHLTMKDEIYREETQELLGKLKDLALLNGVTDEQIAARTGFSTANIYRMFKGKYSPSLDNFLKLAYGVGYEVDLKKINP